MELVQEAIYYLVEPDGTPTAVQVTWETWQWIVAALEGAEDVALAEAALAELDMAGGHPERGGWLRLEDMEDAWK